MAVQQKGDKELQSEFERIFGMIGDMSGVDQSTLADFLDRPIEDVPRSVPFSRAGGYDQQQFGGGGAEVGRRPRYPPTEQRFSRDPQQSMILL